MAAHTFVALDYLVLISLLVLSSGIGVYFAWHDRRKKSNRQFLVANREMNWLPVSLSMMASFLSTTTVLGVPSEVFVRGVTFWMAAISTTLAILMAAFIFMPMYYKMNITSINEVRSLFCFAFSCRFVIDLQVFCNAVGSKETCALDKFGHFKRL